MAPDFDYTVRRSKRRTISLEITAQGTVLVRAPMRLSGAAIEAFAAQRQDWVHAHLRKWEERQKNAPDAEPLTADERDRLREKARDTFRERVTALAPGVGVTWGRITVRFQRSRWGSCSAKGNLNFNALLLLAPPEVLDYVVVHELCHRKELNHSPRFWAEVRRVMPDYAGRRAWLRQNGALLMARLPGAGQDRPEA